MSGTATKNDRKRARLHIAQGGRCFYCPDEIGATLGSKGNPVLEHFIPRSRGGTNVVLACNPCDKMKGMISGPEFKEIMAAHTIEGRPMGVVRQAMAPICKARNRELQEGHVPRAAGMVLTRARTARRAEYMQVVVNDYPPLVTYSTAGAGESGRNAFVEAFEARKSKEGAAAE